MRRNDGRRQTGLGDSFDAYCDHCNITAEGQEYIRSVRRDMIWECGTRRVPQGGFRSEEAGVVIAVGPCTLALGIALESEFSKNAIEYFPNPPTLRFPDLRPRKKQAMLSVNPEFLCRKPIAPLSSNGKRRIGCRLWRRNTRGTTKGQRMAGGLARQSTVPQSSLA